jgi:transposase
MNEDGNIMEQYEIANTDDSWTEFGKRYLCMKPEIALEVSTTGKYIAGKLREMGFSVHPADPVKLALIFNTSKKNDREDSYKLAKLLRLNELPEVHLPSRESDDLRSLVRYRRSIGEDITRIKNRIHALLSSHGITLRQTDIFGRSGLMEIERQSTKLSTSERTVLNRMLSSVIHLRRDAIEIEDQMARHGNVIDDVRLLMTVPGINVYSAVAIVSEIDDIRRFSSKEKLASYSGLTPRQDQSGSRDIRGHISKHGPSMLRIILVTAAHSVIKYSRMI